MTRVKQVVKSAFGRLGLDLRRRSSVPFGVRWQDDVWYLMDHRGRPTLIDVGANVGQTAQMLVQRFPDATIYSFEPVPAAFAELQQNTSRFAGVDCVNVALGDALGEATITTDRQGQNTLMPGVSTQVKSTVDVNTVDAFCADRRIDRINVLKIDTRASKRRCFVDPKKCCRVVASTSCWPSATSSAGGTSLTETSSRFHDLLAQHRFRVVGLYNGGVDGRGWVWGDALMMREGAADQMAVSCSPFQP